jgi:catalase
MLDTPNTLNKGFPKQANQTQGDGFFTAPKRKASGHLRRKRPSTFSDHWSQPRLFYNSLTKVEQQFLINAIRFETSHVQSDEVRKNVLTQLNKVSHDIAVRVAKALGMDAPAADSKYYHNNKTTGVAIFGTKLPTIVTLTVGILVSTSSEGSIDQAKELKTSFEDAGLVVTIVGEVLSDDVGATYSAAEAISFDAIVVAAGAESAFEKQSTLYPPGKPAQIVTDGYNWGKPVGFLGSAKSAAKGTSVSKGEGVYFVTSVDSLVEDVKEGLATFKFTDRFPLDK